MNCPKCGALVARGDVLCKKCGASLVEASEQYTAENTYRPRLILLLQCWVHGISGGHLRWLGYENEAEQIAARYGWKSIWAATFGALFAGAGADVDLTAFFRVFAALAYLTIECIAIIFGKYRSDAHGYPVRWIKPNVTKNPNEKSLKVNRTKKKSSKTVRINDTSNRNNNKTKNLKKKSLKMNDIKKSPNKTDSINNSFDRN